MNIIHYLEASAKLNRRVELIACLLECCMSLSLS